MKRMFMAIDAMTNASSPRYSQRLSAAHPSSAAKGTDNSGIAA
jgi:hypothetical protein